MINHVVFFRLKDKSPEGIAKTSQVLLNMRGRIDELVDVQVGADILHSERSYDLVLMTKFRSLADLDVYQVHPVHKDVLVYMKEALREPSVCIDYETEA